MQQQNTSGQWDVFVKLYPKELEAIELLEKRLGYVFKNRSLLYEAMTHRSSIVESNVKRRKLGKKSLREIHWNERIEFLGDSILGLVISSKLWDFPSASDEGKLSKIRASLVSEASLAKIALSIGLDSCLIIGRGEEKSGARQRESLLADSLEALFGAIYLDGGVDKASQVINALYSPILAHGIDMFLENDHKTHLQEYAQDKFKMTPTYEVVGATGPDHAKAFVVECRLNAEVIGTGTGLSKKKASQSAAKNAFENIQNKKVGNHG